MPRDRLGRPVPVRVSHDLFAWADAESTPRRGIFPPTRHDLGLAGSLLVAGIAWGAALRFADSRPVDFGFLLFVLQFGVGLIFVISLVSQLLFRGFNVDRVAIVAVLVIGGATLGFGTGPRGRSGRDGRGRLHVRADPAGRAGGRGRPGLRVGAGPLARQQYLCSIRLPASNRFRRIERLYRLGAGLERGRRFGLHRKLANILALFHGVDPDLVHSLEQGRVSEFAGSFGERADRAKCAAFSSVFIFVVIDFRSHFGYNFKSARRRRIIARDNGPSQIQWLDELHFRNRNRSRAAMSSTFEPVVSRRTHELLPVRPVACRPSTRRRRCKSLLGQQLPGRQVAAQAASRSGGAAAWLVTQVMFGRLLARLDDLERAGHLSPEQATAAPRPLNAAELGVPSGAPEAAAIDALAMIFEAIFESPELPDAVKSALASLPIPTLKAAMLDSSMAALSVGIWRLASADLAAFWRFENCLEDHRQRIDGRRFGCAGWHTTRCVQRAGRCGRLFGRKVPGALDIEPGQQAEPNITWVDSDAAAPPLHAA